jgi:hypothetical protein
VLTAIRVGALVAVTIMLFDVLAYFTVPAAYTSFAASYRKTRLLSGPAGQAAMTRGGDPRGYFMADPVLGFDIAPRVRMPHEFNATPHEIFSNGLGCFDHNDEALFKAAKDYRYFGGDSFTWGFAEYDSKFATVWERATGKLAAKCGVPHTGQAAQFEKFRRVTAAIGKLPTTVFVGYYVNDPGNDAAFPHTTVIEGYMADTVFVKDGALVRADASEIRKMVEASLHEMQRPRSTVDQLKQYVWVYSLSANIVNEGARALARRAASAATPTAAGGRGAKASQRASSRFGDNLYYWYDTSMKTSFATDPKVAANKAAILEWARHAKAHSYRLVFLLFPARDDFNDPDFFAQVRGWLDANGIEHLDFAQLFRAEGLTATDLYWSDNGHWHSPGNRVVGRLLAKHY